MAKAPPSPALINQFAKELGLSPEQVASAMSTGGGSTAYDPFALSEDVANGTLYVGTGAKEGAYTHKRVLLGNHLFAVDVPGGYDVQVQPQTTPQGATQYRLTIYNTRTGRTSRSMTVTPSGGRSNMPGSQTAERAARFGYRAGQFAPGLGSSAGEFITAEEQGKGHDRGKTVYRVRWQGEGNANLRTPADETDSVENQLKTVYGYSPEQVTALKKQMWMAGMYPQGTDPDSLNGIIDDRFVANIGSVMVQASRYYAAGKKVTWQSLLMSMSQKGPGADGAVDPVHIDLTSEAELTQTIDEAARDKIGQKATPEDVRAFIASVHAKESAEQRANQANKDTLTSSVDSKAEADAYLRTHYPEQMKGVEWADRAAEWTDLLAHGTGMNVGQEVEIT